MNTSRKSSELFTVHKTFKLQRLQEKIKVLEHTNYMLQEKYSQEEMLQAKAIKIYDKSRYKWKKKKVEIMKANREILKIIEHLNRQIGNIKELV